MPRRAVATLLLVLGAGCVDGERGLYAEVDAGERSAVPLPPEVVGRFCSPENSHANLLTTSAGYVAYLRQECDVVSYHTGRITEVTTSSLTLEWDQPPRGPGVTVTLALDTDGQLLDYRRGGCCAICDITSPIPEGWRDCEVNFEAVDEQAVRDGRRSEPFRF